MNRQAAQKGPTNLTTADGDCWFDQARFGMFIHFGLYAMGARHDWLMSVEEITVEDYSRYLDHFDPDLYDPREWARRAREAGMKYVVLTAKHHDGFCLWDSKATDYKVTSTSVGRDLLGPFVEAARAEGLHVGFYYSLLDWHHPDFPIDIHHPLRNHPDAVAMNAGRDVGRYAKYMQDQVRELLTEFGVIDVIWFDFSYPNHMHHSLPGKGRNDWDSENLLKLVRDLQPDIIIGDRLDLPPDTRRALDVITPEQYMPNVAPTVAGQPVRWEACHTLSGSWGYRHDIHAWKDPAQLIDLLVDAVARGGNLLMNVAPTARGEFDAPSNRALDVYGRWLHHHARSIHGAGPSKYRAPSGCRFTQRGNRLYLHIQHWPFRHIHIEGLGGKVSYAQFLHDGGEVLWVDPGKVVEQNLDVVVGEGVLTLELPVTKPDVVSPVIELFLDV